MKKFFASFLLAMFLGVFAIGCSSPPPPNPQPAPEHNAEHAPQTEHDAS